MIIINAIYFIFIIAVLYFITTQFIDDKAYKMVSGLLSVVLVIGIFIVSLVSY